MDASNMDVTIDHIAKDGGKLKAFAMATTEILMLMASATIAARPSV